jgi:hypothetical protein
MGTGASHRDTRRRCRRRPRSWAGPAQASAPGHPSELITPNGDNVDNPTALEPLGGARFTLVSPTRGGAVGEVVRFVEENGRVVRMYVGDGYTDRVRD